MCSFLLAQNSPIRLSPVKAAAYDRMLKQNKEMSDYLAKLTDEKSELRSTLCHLELQVSQYRERENDHFQVGGRLYFVHLIQYERYIDLFEKEQEAWCELR